MIAGGFLLTSNLPVSRQVGFLAIVGIAFCWTAVPGRSRASEPDMVLPPAIEAPATVPTDAPITSGETPALPSTPPIPMSWIPHDLSASARNALLLGAFSIAPAAILMTTSFVRLSIVLGLLRQALGGSNLPSQQVLTALSLCLTLIVMQPTWSEVYRESIVPYTNDPTEAHWQQAWERGIRPIREFMSRQIQLAGNDADVVLFLQYAQPQAAMPRTYEEVPLSVLLSSFILSELKTAFLLGFQIYLPFLVVDLVVASVTTSVGMMMLPPAMVSLPVKLLLFVLVDGWHLVVGMLLDSFHILS